jgi:hypothetical protein
VIQQGDPRLSFWQKDAGVFVQDDIRIRPNFSMAAGLRYDVQNYLSDHNNVAPRLSFAFAPGKDRKTVLRTGAGIFYDRTGARPISDLLYYNGSHLRQITVTNAGYPDPFLGAGGLALQPPNLVRFASNLRSPYLAVYNFGVDQQLTKTTSLSVNYSGTRGIKMFRSRNLNAPYAPLFLPPDPSIGVLRQVESSGHLESHSLRVSLRGSIGHFFTGTANYTWSHTNDNTSGISTFPADNHDLSGEWSRSDFDQRHRLSSFGTFTLPRDLFSLGFIFTASSGSPYSLITGRDDNHDTFATDRPFGVRRNTLVGPDFFQLDARWSKKFMLHETKKGEGPSATVGFDAFNVLNHVNYRNVVGDLSSSLFGRPVSANWPRRMQISLGLGF